jgi:protein-S-isoprenylcysteine O-methyltransferase Ste14
METAMLLKTATILLGITALGGVVMAFIRFSGSDRPPSWLAMLHGLLAGAGLTLLLYAGFTAGVPRSVWTAVALLVLAALGGVFLNLTYHDKRLPLPKGIIVVHALLAVAGFALLFLAAFR